MLTRIPGLVAAVLFASNAMAGTLTYRSPAEVDLPPVAKRKIIGTWKDADSPCTRSFEEVAAVVYEVLRCSDGSGGKTGIRVNRGSRPGTFTSTQHAGDHYIILPSGELSIRDRQGEVSRLPKAQKPGGF